MKYSKQYIASLNKNNDFIDYNLEKVLRLLDVLNFIGNSKYKNVLVLKGGTALNLFYLGLDRLSVDIDLDYIGSLNKETTQQERNEIINEIDSYMIKEGYQRRKQSRMSHILSQLVYIYKNASDNLDNIKIEINFIDRMHIEKEEKLSIALFNNEASILLPNKYELYGMKIAALIDRLKPRDLYDVYRIIKLSDFNELIYQSAIFYLGLDKIPLINEKLIERINDISFKQIKTELYPVLRKNNYFNIDEVKDYVIRHLKSELIKDNYNTYLNNLKNKEIDLSIINIKGELESHPMLQWVVKNK